MHGASEWNERALAIFFKVGIIELIIGNNELKEFMSDLKRKRKGREMVSGLELVQRIYDLILEVHPVIVKKFPKSQRFVLGQRIENTLMTLLEVAITITLSKPSEHFFKKMDIELQKLKLLIRLSKDLQFISIKKYEHLQRIVIEIGKLLGGYKKFLL